MGSQTETDTTPNLAVRRVFISSGLSRMGLAALPPGAVDWDKVIESSRTVTEQWKCTICEQKFTCKNYMKKHMKAHAGELEFSCEICEKKFWQRQDLEGHMSSHTNEKLFDCSICGNKFSYKRSLRRHLKGVHHVDWRCLLEDSC